MNTAMMHRRAAALVLAGAPIMGIAGSSQAQNAGATQEKAGPNQAQNGGANQEQKALKIVMVPKFTGTAYFAATEKGAKEAVAELKEKGVAIDFLYTGPSVANTDEEISIIDDLVAQKPDAIIIAASDADKLVPVAKKAKDSGIKVIT
jgi:ABC-type sugar transport system substrate-binding protein